MLTLSGVVYRLGGRTLLNGASAQIASRSRVGLVGRNGTGKSTLLDLIRGARQPDGGTIRLMRGARIGFLAQEAPGGALSAHEAVLAAGHESTRLDDSEAYAAPARAARILAGLGLDEAMQHRPLGDLSGGWRMRAALAAILFAEPDLLLLDEPTNHLDLEAALWLERFLARYRHTLILVSHDRGLLNAVTTMTLHLDRGKLTAYAGDFNAFLRARREAAQRQDILARQQAQQREKLQSFIDRFRAKASKARQAQSRLKALARLEPVVLVADEPPPRLVFPPPPPLAPPLVTFERVSVGYEAGKPVLSRLDLRLDPDDRVALLGANGNGKTTLARLFSGRLAPLSGRVTRSPKFACGFFAQHQIEEMRPQAAPFDHLQALLPEATAEAVRTRLGGFGFGQDKAFVPVAELSGGERARLALALATHHAPALLILDEPTNHLDIETREALVAALNAFPGAVVLVTHDWHLVELVAERLWLVAGGTVRPFEGDLSDYRRALEISEPEPVRRPEDPESRRAQRRLAALRRRDLEPLRQKVRHAEERIARLLREQKALDRALAKPGGFGGDGAALSEALKQRAELARLLAEAESEWLAAEEAIERASAD
ncbi:MAG TPA: ABC-F family ATP-binding cassette domain-containing protein [Stellaceae bacterium]|nr:ABC-F family ATP-binding cassette domain-containing protein [Stellaceae bacterium]